MSEPIFSTVFLARLGISAVVGISTVAPIAFFVADYVVTKSVELQSQSIELLDGKMEALDGRLSGTTESLNRSIAETTKQMNLNAQILAGVKTSVELQDRWLPGIAEDTRNSLKLQAEAMKIDVGKEFNLLKTNSVEIQKDYELLKGRLQKVETTLKDSLSRKKFVNPKLDALLAALLPESRDPLIEKVRFRKSEWIVELISGDGEVLRSFLVPPDNRWFDVAEDSKTEAAYSIVSPKYLIAKYQAMYPVEFEKQKEYLREGIESNK